MYTARSVVGIVLLISVSGSISFEAADITIRSLEMSISISDVVTSLSLIYLYHCLGKKNIQKKINRDLAQLSMGPLKLRESFPRVSQEEVRLTKPILEEEPQK